MFSHFQKGYIVPQTTDNKLKHASQLGHCRWPKHAHTCCLSLVWFRTGAVRFRSCKQSPHHHEPHLLGSIERRQTGEEERVAGCALPFVGLNLNSIIIINVVREQDGREKRSAGYAHARQQQQQQQQVPPVLLANFIYCNCFAVFRCGRPLARSKWSGNWWPLLQITHMLRWARLLQLA